MDEVADFILGEQDEVVIMRPQRPHQRIHLTRDKSEGILFESIDPDMVWDKIRGSASGSLKCELANDVAVVSGR